METLYLSTIYKSMIKRLTVHKKSQDIQLLSWNKINSRFLQYVNYKLKDLNILFSIYILLIWDRGKEREEREGEKERPQPG